jgi:hypothetical protein
MSRSSHFNAAGTTTRRASLGCASSQGPSWTSGLDISENSANWLRMRVSIEGGSMKATNGVRASASNARSDG